MKTGKLIRNIGAVVTIWLCCETITAFCQTNETRFEVVTNMVTADANFRIVNGKLYNRAKSNLWKVLQGECEQTTNDLIVIKTFTTEPIYQASVTTGWSHDGLGGSTRVLQPTKVKVGDEKKWGIKIALRNYNETKPYIGKVIIVAGMQDGSVEIENETLELWDCGKVNVVAVVTTNVFSPEKMATKVATENKK